MVLKSGYRADIDGIRAIAVLLVVVFHFDLVRFGAAGFIGVDIFFVISGFLISSLIWRRLGEGTFSLSQFYVHRVRRLAPALIATQVLLLVATVLALLPEQTRSAAWESIAAQTYVSNFYYWQTLNYFGLRSSSAFMLHTWSLGVEEQFYLFFPIFAMAVNRLAPRFFGVALSLVFLGSFALNLTMLPLKPEATFYLLPTRCWELAAGALVPFAAPYFASRWTRGAGGIAAFGLLAAALLLYGHETPYPGWFAVLPVMVGMLLLLAGEGDGSWVSNLLSLPSARFFGLISYPLYLVHWPIFVTAETVLPDNTLDLRWMEFALSVVLAYAIYEYCEKPIRGGRWFKSNRLLLFAYLLATSILLAVLGTAIASGGWRGRFSPEVLRVADGAKDVDTAAKRWDFRDGEPVDRQIRRVGSGSANPTWLIFGDSHAQALSRAISLWLAGRGEAGLLVSHSGCPPILDSGSNGCRAFVRSMIARVGGRNVLLVSIWRQPLEPGYLGTHERPLKGEAARIDFGYALGRTIAAIHAEGGRIYIWGPLPAAPYRLPEALAYNRLYGNFWPTMTTLKKHRHDMLFFDNAVAHAPKGLIAGRIDPAIDLCPGGVCPLQINGEPLYSDTNHPTLSSAPLFASILARQLPRK